MAIDPDPEANDQSSGVGVRVFLAIGLVAGGLTGHGAGRSSTLAR